MLVPGLEYTFETLVECVSDLGISDQLYVFVTKDEVRKLWQCVHSGVCSTRPGSGTSLLLYLSLTSVIVIEYTKEGFKH